MSPKLKVSHCHCPLTPDCNLSLILVHFYKKAIALICNSVACKEENCYLSESMAKMTAYSMMMKKMIMMQVTM